MSTITIDSTLYQEAERFAAQRNMTITGFFEYAIRKIMKTMPSMETKNYRDTLEYQQAMQYMDSFVAEDLAAPVPAEEKGMGALVEEKYLP